MSTSGVRSRHGHKPFRRFARLAVDVGGAFEVRTLALGVNGMTLVAPINPPEGATCVVRFSLPVNGAVAAAFEAHARVARSVLSGTHEGFMLDLIFDKLTPDGLSQIRAYINEPLSFVR